LAKLVQGDTPLLLPPAPERAPHARPEREERVAAERRDTGKTRPARQTMPPRSDANIGEARFDDDAPAKAKRPRGDATPEVGMETFRIEVGHVHGVQPGNIVGAIANEADLESRFIGRIDIRDDHSLVDLPEGMPREVLEILKKTRVAGRPLRISRSEETGAPRGRGKPGKPPHAPPRKPGFVKRKGPR
jgi:ATP-dependent RNA helicase DeaD